MRALTFPSGPDRLVVRAVEFLDHFFDRTEYVVGGGTCLAARWNHRHSTDVDCFANPECYARTYSRGAARLPQALQALEQKYLVAEQDCGAGGMTIVFTDLGEVSLAPAAPMTSAGLTDEYESQTGVRLEHTAEILAKKIRLRMMGGRFLHRDAYDLVVARVEDPKSFELAFNVLGDHLKRTIGTTVRWAADQRLLETGRVIDPRYPQAAMNAWWLLAEAFDGRGVELGSSWPQTTYPADDKDVET